MKIFKSSYLQRGQMDEASHPQVPWLKI